MERAIVRQSTLKDGVITARIPNSLLQSPFTIKAHVGRYEDDTFKVIETVKIPIIAKPKPADYKLEDTDEELYSFNELENKLSNAVSHFLKEHITIKNGYWWVGDTNTGVKAEASGSSRISDVVLLANKWIGDTSPYSQVVTINGVTENSQVDLTPNVEQLAIFYDKDLTFVTENNGGVVTVYAIGQKPENNYTIQATITEVAV
jgi:hypothetical protein